MQKDYIDRNGLLRTIYAAARRSSLGETGPAYLDWKTVVLYIQDAPSEDVVPREEYDVEPLRRRLQELEDSNKQCMALLSKYIEVLGKMRADFNED